MLLSSWYQRSYFLCRGGSSALDIYRMPVLLQHFRGEYQALLLAFLCHAFTFWKTTLYMIQYTPLCKGASWSITLTGQHTFFCSGEPMVGGSLCPSSVWLACGEFWCQWWHINTTWSRIEKLTCRYLPASRLAICVRGPGALMLVFESSILHLLHIDYQLQFHWHVAYPGIWILYGLGTRDYNHVNSCFMLCPRRLDKISLKGRITPWFE